MAIFCKSYDWSKSFNTRKNTLQKWSLNIPVFLFRRLPFCRLVHILCVKLNAFLCEESVLHIAPRNCFPSYSDHYLISWLTILQIFSYKISRHYTVSAGRISLEMGKFWLGIDLWLLLCSSAHTCRIFHISKIQLVVYYQSCILIGWATTRLYVIAH